MPAFFHPEFWQLDNPELWVAVGLILFLAIVWFAGGFKKAGAALDAKASTIQHNLDEAARLRAEAEAMLADIRKQRAEAEAQGAAMLKGAEEAAKQFVADAKVKLDEQIKRRQAVAEGKIAAAEAAATAEVRAAAVDLAAGVAEQVLSSRLSQSKSDPLADRAIQQLAGKFQ